MLSKTRIKVLILVCLIARFVFSVNGPASDENSFNDPIITEIPKATNSSSKSAPNTITTPDAVEKALKISIIGFNTAHSRAVLSNIVDGDLLFENTTHQYHLLKNAAGIKLAVANYTSNDVVNSDMSFTYVSKLTLVNEDVIAMTMYQAIKSLLSSNPSKKILIVVLACKSSETSAIVGKLTRSLDIAWNLVDKPKSFSNDINDALDIQILSVSPSSPVISPSTVDIIKNKIALISNTSRLLSDLFLNEKSIKVKSTIDNFYKQNTNLTGINSLDVIIQAAATLAQKNLTELLQKAQKKEFASNFSSYIYSLRKQCIKSLLDDAKSSGITNSILLKSAENDIQRQIMSMALPLFRRQVQLSRQQVIKDFNRAVVDDFELSARISTDLRNARNAALRSFQKSIQLLTPPDSPLSWNCQSDILQLRKTLDEYIENREIQARIDGVLPRGRKPLEISFHAFFAHPFGKDYRQDVITHNDKNDKLIYDPELAKVKNVLVKPSTARSIMKKILRNKKKSSIYTKTDSEFAREMLMFPLFIKNPEVPFLSSHRKKKASSETLVPKKKLEVPGPERFIRWDIAPLDEVKSNLDAIQARRSRKINLLMNLFSKQYWFEGYKSKLPALRFENKMSHKSKIY